LFIKPTSVVKGSQGKSGLGLLGLGLSRADLKKSPMFVSFRENV
jgi:hypothetical protein